MYLILASEYNGKAKREPVCVVTKQCGRGVITAETKSEIKTDLSANVLLTCIGNHTRCARDNKPQRMFKMVYPLHQEKQTS